MIRALMTESKSCYFLLAIILHMLLALRIGKKKIQELVQDAARLGQPINQTFREFKSISLNRVSSKECP